MIRTRLFRYAHLAGHALWWVFVVAAMLAGGLDWFGADDTYEFGWTSFAPMNGMPRRYADYVPAEGFQSTDVVAVAAFCLLVLAAVVEAVAARRMGAGIVTVAVPFVAAALLWSALPRGHADFLLTPIPALLVILAAVALRELWERRFAPTVDSGS